MSTNTETVATVDFPTYEVTIGVFDRPFEVVYLTTAHNVDYALASVETMAMNDKLLGKRGFKQHDITVSYARYMMPWNVVC